MKKKTDRYCQAKAAFELPDWFPPERLNYNNGRYDDRFHPTDGNSAVDALLKLTEVREVGINPTFSATAIIDLYCHPKRIPAEITKFEAKLERFLRRYKEHHQ